MEYTTHTTNLVLIAGTIIAGLWILYKSRDIESNPMKEHRAMVKAMNEILPEDPDYTREYCAAHCPRTHICHECGTSPGRGSSYRVFGFNHLVCPTCMTKNHEGE